MNRKFALAGSVILALGAIAFAVAAKQQDKSKRPSPPAQAKCTLSSGKTITIDYSSPRMKGRKIYGGLVPFNEVWRAGANEATTLTTTADLTIDGKAVPAGTYTLFTIPTPEKWTLIVSKKTGEWGIPYPGDKDDFARLGMKVSKLPSSLEDFTIGLDKNAQGCTLRMDWETTRASVELAAK